MNVVVALAAQALQQQVAVDARGFAQAVATEGVVGPFAFVLHEILHPSEPLPVGLVEVLPLRLLDAFRAGGFRYGLYFRLGQVDGHRFQGAEEHVQIQRRKEEQIDHEQRALKMYGEDDVKHRRKSHSRAVADQVARQVDHSHQYMGQAENIDDIVDGKTQCGGPQQDVAAQQVAGQFATVVYDDRAAAQEHSQHVKGNEHQGRRGVFPHTPPLQITRHADAQRIDALQIRAGHQHQQHDGVQHARRGAFQRKGMGDGRAEPRAEDAHDPRERQILHFVAGVERQRAGDHQMNRGAEYQCEQKG